MNNFWKLYRSELFLKTTSVNSVRMRSLAVDTTKDIKVPEFETLHITTPAPFVFNVELNRPAKRNAMNHTMWMDIQKCFDTLNEDENCRSVVLSGNGQLFCSGIDLQCFMDISKCFKETDDVARRSKALYKTIRLYQNSLSSMEKCVKPVIAAVHSGCIGGAVNMITAADIRFCSSDAWFQIKEIDMGMAADVGVLQRLPKIIGSASLVRELVFTGRKFSAQEAKDCGFFSKVFESKDQLMEESIKIAAEIASKSPVAVQTAKKSLIFSQDHTVDESLEHIALLNQTMLQSEDLMTAIMATVSKNTEPPVFSKL